MCSFENNMQAYVLTLLSLTPKKYRMRACHSEEGLIPPACYQPLYLAHASYWLSAASTKQSSCMMSAGSFQPNFNLMVNIEISGSTAAIRLFDLRRAKPELIPAERHSHNA